jgi:branched-subunit amino acid aminotransferase/4-amino-4-deoxychorismate lyase
MDGELMETSNAVDTAMSEVYLGVFEGIKAYVEGNILDEGPLNIFQWKPHAARLRRSAASSLAKSWYRARHRPGIPHSNTNLEVSDPPRQR